MNKTVTQPNNNNSNDETGIINPKPTTLMRYGLLSFLDKGGDDQDGDGLGDGGKWVVHPVDGRWGYVLAGQPDWWDQASATSETFTDQPYGNVSSSGSSRRQLAHQLARHLIAAPAELDGLIRDDDTGCYLCQPGRFASDTGHPACTACLKGNQQPESGSDSCDCSEIRLLF